MKRLCVVLGILVGASLLPKAASAGPINVVDPIIGVRGGMFGSPGPSASFGAFGSCSGISGATDSAQDLADAGFSCFVVNITGEEFGLGTTGLLSAVLQVQTLDGFNAGNFQEDEGVTCTIYDELCTPRPGSAFNVQDLFMNGLVSFDGDDQSLRCGDSNCVDALFYIKPGPGEDQSLQFQMAARTINGQPVTTPEPGTLLLMGTGIATLAGRRLRRKNS